jgi:hypothetical protein
LTDAKQPDRLPTDGAVAVQRNQDGETVCIMVESNGSAQFISCSEFNAWRLFGMMAPMLGIKLPSKLARGIRL